jgi:hypothetical protein
MSFSRLIDDLARERDQRGRMRDVAILTERNRIDGRSHRKAMRALTGELEVMAKSMHAAVVRSRVEQKQSALDRLAAISAEGNELAAAGKLSAYEGARLDGAIAAAADRILGR